MLHQVGVSFDLIFGPCVTQSLDKATLKKKTKCLSTILNVETDHKNVIVKSSSQFLSKTCIQITGLDNLVFESKYTRKKGSFRKCEIRSVWQCASQHYEGCRIIKAGYCSKRQLSDV